MIHEKYHDTPLGEWLVFIPVPIEFSEPLGDPDETEVYRRAAALRETWTPWRRKMAEGAYAPQSVTIPMVAMPRNDKRTCAE